LAYANAVYLNAARRPRLDTTLNQSHRRRVRASSVPSIFRAAT
jgi:hypothetical protein